MRDIIEIREEINGLDAEIAHLLTKRMNCIKEIIEYKRVTGTPIFQPEQEKKQASILADIYEEDPFAEEQAQIFKTITTMSKKVQAKTLLPYNIALIGFMGAGKSTVAAYLKDMLAMDLVETDALIEENAGMSINDIFAKFGEPYFRNLESNAVIQLESRRQTIISCGGGLAMREENVQNLKKNARIVLLTATPETILERVRENDDRPILRGNKNVNFIAELMAKRADKYKEAADLILPTDGKDVREICEELIKRIH